MSACHRAACPWRPRQSWQRAAQTGAHGGGARQLRHGARLEPENTDANFNAALTRLCLGDFVRAGNNTNTGGRKRIAQVSAARLPAADVDRRDRMCSGRPSCFCRARFGRRASVRALRAFAGGARRQSAACGAVAAQIHGILARRSAGPDRRRAGAGFRSALPAYEPAVGFWHRARDGAGEDSLSAPFQDRLESGGHGCRTTEGCGSDCAGRVQWAHERSQSLNTARAFCQASLGARPRFHQLAEGRQRRRRYDPARIRRCQLGQQFDGFLRYRRGRRHARSRHRGRYFGCASCRRDGQGCGVAGCRSRRIGAGCSIAPTVRGIRPCGCSGRRRSAIGTARLAACVRN